MSTQFTHAELVNKVNDNTNVAVQWGYSLLNISKISDNDANPRIYELTESQQFEDGHVREIYIQVN